MKKHKKISLSDFLFKSLMVVFLVGYSMVFYTAMRFNFAKTLPDGIYRWNYYLNKKELLTALSVTYIIIILLLVAFFKSRTLLDFCSSFIKSKMEKLYKPMKALFIGICAVLVVIYTGIICIEIKYIVVLPDEDIDVAKSAVEISYQGREENREIYDLCVKLWCASDNRLSMQKNITIKLAYKNGTPVNMVTDTTQLYTSGRSMSNDFTWDDLGIEYKCNNELIIKWLKKVIDINIYGNFYSRNYIGVSPLLKVTLPLMFLHKDGNHMFYWKSENLFTTVSVPFDAFIVAKEYGTYSFAQDYMPFDYEFTGYNIDFDKNNVRKFTEGSLVCVKSGAADYYGTNLFDYVYDRQYIISQLDGDRAVIVLNDEIIAAMNIADLYFAKEFY